MKYQMFDIVAISNTIEHPNIFLTISFNPTWEKRTEFLLPRQTD